MSCEVCEEHSATWPTTPSHCGHRFCVQCVTQYLTARVVERRLPLQCLACDAEVERVAAYEIIIDPSLRAKLEDFEVQKLLQLDSQTRFCPRPDCGIAVLCPPSMTACPRIRCEGCAADFCYSCRDVWHSGACPTLAVTADTQLVKPCPACHVLIDKVADGTCNAVRCTICNTQFCWLCLTELSGSASVSHFTSLNGCTMFGSQRWSPAKRRLWRVSTPLTAPLAIVGLALLAPVAIVGVPIMTAVDVWQAAKENCVPRAKRVLKTVSAAVTATIFVPPAIVIVVTVVSLRLLAFAYIQMPFEQIRDAVLHRRDKRLAARASIAARAAGAELPPTPALLALPSSTTTSEQSVSLA